MSRLCRLRTRTHGKDGQWAYDEIVKLRALCDQLGEALEIAHELYANASQGYGFAKPENPHNYWPDIESCSPEEIAAHSQACSDYDAGKKVKNESLGIGTYSDEYTPALEALAAWREMKK